MEDLKGWYAKASKFDFSQHFIWDEFENYLKSIELIPPITHWSDEYALADFDTLVDNLKFNTVKEMAPTSRTMLDIGCNKGYLAHLLRDNFEFICGMDICEKSVDIAQARHGGNGINFTCFKFEDFLKNDTKQTGRYGADTVVALAVEHHFHDLGMKVIDVAKVIDQLANRWILIELIKNEKGYVDVFKQLGWKVHTAKPSQPAGRNLVLFERS